MDIKDLDSFVITLFLAKYKGEKTSEYFMEKELEKIGGKKMIDKINNLANYCRRINENIS